MLVLVILCSLLSKYFEKFKDVIHRQHRDIKFDRINRRTRVEVLIKFDKLSINSTLVNNQISVIFTLHASTFVDISHLVARNRVIKILSSCDPIIFQNLDISKLFSARNPRITS